MASAHRLPGGRDSRGTMGGDLEAFLSADETAYELLLRTRRPSARTGLKRLDRFIYDGQGVPPGECVTVTGERGSGKSALLRAMAVNAVLPRACGGAEQTVVFFDNDWSAGTEELLAAAITAALLASRKAQPIRDIHAAAGGGGGGGGGGGHDCGGDDDDDDFPDDDFSFDDLELDAAADTDDAVASGAAATVPPEVAALVEQCLERVLLVRCKSSFEFLLTMGTLFTRPEVRAGDGVALILVDSLASFHLHDVSCPPGQAERTHTHINFLLRRLAARHRIPIVGAKPASVLADGSREYEPSIWTGLRAWDLRLTRVNTRASSSSSSRNKSGGDGGGGGGEGGTGGSTTTLVKVEVRRFSPSLGTDRRTGTVMLRLDEEGLS